MNSQTPYPGPLPQGEGVIASGRFNEAVGWILLCIGLAHTPYLDFHALQQESETLRARHVQGVVLGMALMQLAIGRLLASEAFTSGERRIAGFATAIGAIIYASGFGMNYFRPESLLVPIGSAFNLAGLLYLLSSRPTGLYALHIRMILPVVTFGMFLDFATAILPLVPHDWIREHLGEIDGVRQRMLRLARVAAIALSVVTLLYFGIHRLPKDQPLGDRLGRVLMFGAIGMPLILSFAAAFWLPIKYLLPIPATSVMIGVIAANWAASKTAHWLERFGWATILASISVGMLMGMYAFEGPFPTPAFLGEYRDLPRRLSWVSHSYAVVFGIVAIFLAYKVRAAAPGAVIPWAAAIYVIGSVIAVSVLVARIAVDFPPVMFVVGPALSLMGVIGVLGFSSKPSR